MKCLSVFYWLSGCHAYLYSPVLTCIHLCLPVFSCVRLCLHVISKASEVCVLVPGAGLGRLAYEIARLGYVCQGNEFSLFMLFTSNFILNKLVYLP